MSETKKGVLEKAYEKNGFWSILVDDVWYGTYKTSYKELEGSPIVFTATQKGKYWNAGDVKVDTVAQKAEPAKGAPRQSSDARQQSIVVQSSFKTATELVGHMLQNDCIVLPAKKADRYDAIVGLVKELTLDIYGVCIDPTDFIAGADSEPAPGPGDDYVPHEA